MITDWKKLQEHRYDAGYRKLVRRKYELPDGRQEDYDIHGYVASAAVVAFTPEGKVVLARQFRPGPEKVLYELPGGDIDHGEEPIQAAARELLEETGYQGEMEYIGWSYYDAYAAGVRHHVIARNCKKIAEPAGDSSEFIEPVEMSLAEFRQHLKSGQLTDVTTGYLALDHLNLL